MQHYAWGVITGLAAFALLRALGDAAADWVRGKLGKK